RWAQGAGYMRIGRRLRVCLALVAVAVTSGCAVYATPDGSVVTPAPVVVAPPPAVVVSPFGFYGHYHHHASPRRYYHAPRYAPRAAPRHGDRGSGPRYHGRPYHRF